MVPVFLSRQILTRIFYASRPGGNFLRWHPCPSTLFTKSSQRYSSLAFVTISPTFCQQLSLPRIQSTQLFYKRKMSENSFKIYTKTGDQGTSSLFSGERRSKLDPVFEALGSIDEISSNIGNAIAKCRKDNLQELRSQLYEIQCMLQDIGAHVATPPSSSSEAHLERTAIPNDYTTAVEGWIDDMTAVLPELKSFILPGGSELAAALHCTRTVCRRAERRVIDANARDHISESALQLMNRLSDYFFTAARFANIQEGTHELVYRSATKRRNREISYLNFNMQD
eukprot:gene3613-6204_t